MSAARRVRAVVRKDLVELLRNRQALVPIIVVPLLFAVVIPVVVIALGANPAVMASVNGLQAFLDNLPDGVAPPGLSEEQTIVYAIVVYFMAPFFLTIPVMVATITASASIVGEKERRTIEGLLYTPVTDGELVLAKVLVSLVPAVAVTWISFVLYAVVVDTLGAAQLGGVVFPTPTWVVAVVVLVPLLAFLATSVIVAVSGRSTTVQGAQSSAVLVVLPVIALVIGQAAGVVLFTLPFALAVSAAVLVVDIVVFRAVAAGLRRERIVTRL
jgi:ABC-2 type transport system permease protein